MLDRCTFLCVHSSTRGGDSFRANGLPDDRSPVAHPGETDAGVQTAENEAGCAGVEPPGNVTETQNYTAASSSLVRIRFEAWSRPHIEFAGVNPVARTSRGTPIKFLATNGCSEEKNCQT